jgi:hypothetical protein
VDDVERYLRGREMTNYVEIADELDAIPWDILRACRALVRQGRAEEGRESLLGYFRLSAETEIRDWQEGR